MAPSALGVTEAVSFALGGIIGGGIFAVLGVEELYFDREAVERGIETVEKRR